jgi:phage gp46-like protein
MLAAMFLGPQLVFDPATRRCDRAFDGTDLVLDTTPATTLLVSIGSDRRAHTDDTLPDVVTNHYAPNRLNARRGYPGDALDGSGRLIGSRLWLLKRRKQDEATRQLAENAAAEALAHFETDQNMPVTITVRWAARNVLGMLLQLGAAQATMNVPVGG